MKLLIPWQWCQKLGTWFFSIMLLWYILCAKFIHGFVMWCSNSATIMASRLVSSIKRCISYVCVAKCMIMNIGTSFLLSRQSASGERGFLVSSESNTGIGFLNESISCQNLIRWVQIRAAGWMLWWNAIKHELNALAWKWRKF